MADHSEGEFELVLGNRQLFSVLGIVVILLGIFFAMGFFAGKSIGQSPAAPTVAQKPADQTPLVVDSPQSTATPESAAPVATESAVPPVKQATPSTQEQPATHEKKGAAAKKSPEPPAAKTEASKGSDQVVVPAPGAYLQIAATRLSEAQSLAALLRKHEFHVVLAASKKAELIRVLVGPFSSTEATASARAKLKSLDISKPMPTKYPQN
jgi:cell division septation protein DedD